ncbi:MAG: hypothetical protein JOY66_02295 [Acetobacteraceae bacterium]|nr:hypothetical protein [Acetobacteraceae bacterium]
MDEDARLMDAAATAAGSAWSAAPLVLGTGLTGAAVLRATGRVFVGLGSRPGSEEEAPHENERKPRNRPLWLMLSPALVLLGTALVWSEGVRAVARNAAHGFLAVAGQDAVSVPLSEPPHPSLSWLSLGVTPVVAAYDLGRDRVPTWAAAGIGRISRPLFSAATGLHGGIVGDYVTWITVGLALFTAMLRLGWTAS